MILGTRSGFPRGGWVGSEPFYDTQTHTSPVVPFRPTSLCIYNHGTQLPQAARASLAFAGLCLQVAVGERCCHAQGISTDTGRHLGGGEQQWAMGALVDQPWHLHHHRVLGKEEPTRGAWSTTRPPCAFTALRTEGEVSPEHHISVCTPQPLKLGQNGSTSAFPPPCSASVPREGSALPLHTVTHLWLSKAQL